MRTYKEGPRGCGFRSKGLYLTLLNGKGYGCGRLPIPLTVCPCCGEGIRRSRAARWIQAGLMLGHPCKFEGTPDVRRCNLCPMMQFKNDTPVLLIWIGSGHYPTPEAFLREANRMGISRKIAALPRGFKLGETWVALAHERADSRTVDDEGGNLTAEAVPGIFHLFKPNEVQYVTDGSETEEELQKMKDRGITPVKVIPQDSQGPELFGQN